MGFKDYTLYSKHGVVLTVLGAWYLDRTGSQAGYLSCLRSNSGYTTVHRLMHGDLVHGVCRSVL
jgi:hypothetical protein